MESFACMKDLSVLIDRLNEVDAVGVLFCLDRLLEDDDLDVRERMAEVVSERVLGFEVRRCGRSGGNVLCVFQGLLTSPFWRLFGRNL